MENNNKKESKFDLASYIPFIFAILFFIFLDFILSLFLYLVKGISFLPSFIYGLKIMGSYGIPMAVAFVLAEIIGKIIHADRSKNYEKGTIKAMIFLDIILLYFGTRVIGITDILEKNIPNIGFRYIVSFIFCLLISIIVDIFYLKYNRL